MQLSTDLPSTSTCSAGSAPPRTYLRAAREFGEAGIQDMVVLIGLYLTVCAIVNAFEVPVPVGTRPESSTS